MLAFIAAVLTAPEKKRKRHRIMTEKLWIGCNLFA